MWTEYIDNIITALVSILGSGSATWIFARKKYKADVDTTNIENMKNTLDFYVLSSKANKEKLEELTEENKELREENTKLKEEAEESKVRIHKLEIENTELKTRMDSLEQAILELKRSKRPNKKVKTNH